MSDQWEVVIGLETHVRLLTQSKLFSSSANHFGDEPNRHANFVDAGLPGVLPVLNEKAVDHAIAFGLAVGASVEPYSIFARKNYFYPDMPKGYQISQCDQPVVKGGQVSFLVNDEVCRVDLVRAHLEEDAGKSIHDLFHSQTGIDLNRAGTPLLEIVTHPQLFSVEAAVSYAKALHQLVKAIGICDGNMQEGSFRCDANVSVRRPGKPLGTRREIKNLNSFRFLKQAIAYEINWQIETLLDGGVVRQATVLFDPISGETRSMRDKENADDYRYFPDPDLMPLVITEAQIKQVRQRMPELPEKRFARYREIYALSEYEARYLSEDLETASYFEDMLEQLGKQDAKLATSWIMGEMASRLNQDEMSLANCPVGSGKLAELLLKVSDGTLSRKIAKEIFETLWQHPTLSIEAYIKEKGLGQISDDTALAQWAAEVIEENPRSVEEFRSGKDKAINALLGQVMKKAKGKPNPKQLNEILRSLLNH